MQEGTRAVTNNLTEPGLENKGLVISPFQSSPPWLTRGTMCGYTTDDEASVLESLLSGGRRGRSTCQVASRAQRTSIFGTMLSLIGGADGVHLTTVNCFQRGVY